MDKPLQQNLPEGSWSCLELGLQAQPGTASLWLDDQPVALDQPLTACSPSTSRCG